MVPLESNAAGKPCIAVREGGFLETIKEGKNGLFFNPDKKSLLTAIEKFEKMKWNYRYIKKKSMQYDIKVFSNKIRKIVLDTIKKRKL
jgi:glycosyltransferase involved in cell wall biosynthesis